MTVATIEASGPYIDTDVITLMKSTDSLLTIRGFGFGLAGDSQPNIVTLVPSAGNSVHTNWKCTVVNSIHSGILFTALNPENAGSWQQM